MDLNSGRSRIANKSIDLCLGMLRNRGIEFDLSKGLLILDDVLLQDRHQGFCLLRTQIDALEVVDLNFRSGLRLKATKDQQEIPNAGPDLHRVGIAFAIVRGVHQMYIRLLYMSHIRSLLRLS